MEVMPVQDLDEKGRRDPVLREAVEHIAQAMRFVTAYAPDPLLCDRAHRLIAKRARDAELGVNGNGHLGTHIDTREICLISAYIRRCKYTSYGYEMKRLRFENNKFAEIYLNAKYRYMLVDM
ncbi:hypothetical protein GPY61_02975 [Massilia sp. NEAU-DD11]|uniref:Uncharacterized protein n=1 Tax=Massilia cellulosiltytica TaxID=2683234 RepID=A0A7X3FXG7_9BURK|nr:hypothetical protein [Telluria cellulosilytica]MVW58887.1 hypothetical protein [Telluria cellulosilytica]